MAYIGNIPAESFISFEKQVFTIVNSQTAYTLSHSVVNENDIRLVVNNVVQEPGSGKAYTASGTTLTLSAALVNGTDTMYCVFLGRAIQTVNPPNASVGTAQLADDAVTSAKLASGANTPSFLVMLNTNQSIATATNTVIAFDVEVFDTDSAISSGVFTVPSGKAGKYFFSVNGGMNTSNTINTIKIFLSKNSQTDITSNAGDAIGIQFKHSGTPSEIIHSLSGTMDLAVGDTVRVYINHDYGSNKKKKKRGQFTFSGNKLI